MATFDINLNGVQGTITFGTVGQIPYANAAGDDFDYSGLTYTPNLLTVEGRIDLNDGGNSVYVGDSAGVVDDRTDNRNVGVGFNALGQNEQGTNLTAVGYAALASVSNANAIKSSAFGAFALSSNTNGNRNTALGGSALAENISGGENLAAGVDSGVLIENLSNDTDSNSSVFLGAFTKAKGASQTNQIVIGHSAVGNGSNTVTIGNDSITDTYLKGNIRGTFAGTLDGATGSGNTLTFSDSQFFKNFSFGTSYISNHRQDVVDAAGTYYPNEAGYLIGNLKTAAILNSASLIYAPTASKTSAIPLIKPSATDLTFARASTKTRINENGERETVAINVPAVDFSSGEGKLLLEQQRTNLLLNSDTLVTQSITTTAQTYTLSIEGTGTVTLSGSATGVLVGTGDTPQDRQVLIFTATAGSLTLTVSGSVIFAQCEAGADETSYIPTLGAAVTRLADTSTTTGLTSTINSVEGVLLFTATPLGGSTIIQINNGSVNNRIRVDFLDTGFIRFFFTLSGSNQVIDVSTPFTYGTEYKIAVNYGLNDFRAYVNGVKEVEDLSVSPIPANTMNQFEISSSNGNLNLSKVILEKTTLTDATLIAQTT